MWRFDKARIQAELQRGREAIAAGRPQLDADRIRPSTPLVVYKTVDDARVRDDADAIDSTGPVDYTDALDFLQEQIDVTNQFAGRDRREIDKRISALRSEVAALKGKIEVLSAMLGGADGVRSATGNARTRRQT
jgi:hypothetical protein